MRRFIYLFFLFICTYKVQAQTENPKISTSESPTSQMKSFDGFILDMGTMLNVESLMIPLTLPTLNYLVPLDESNSFRINPDAINIKSNLNYIGSNSIIPSHSSILSIIYNGIGSGIVNWQGTSYKLNNGMKLNMYGEYNADGYKVYNPSALPWEKNNFNAAFEMKSANGNFGIKIEVHGGRNNPY